MDDEEPEEADPLPLKRSSVTVPIIAEPPAAAAQDGIDGGSEGYEDLAYRTRRSMAGYEAARQKAQLERRRSLRKSKLLPPTTPGTGRSAYFPAVDEEEGNSTLLLAEKLMSGEAQDDYEAVFMSRPKLKSSPVGTPVRELWAD
jgi:hypothetical protein